MELRYSVQGVDCPNCAAKIESALEKLPGVRGVTLNFPQASLRVLALEDVDLRSLEEGMSAVFSANENGSSFRRDEERADEEGHRIFLLPQGDVEEMLAALVNAGIEARLSDREARTAQLDSAAPWRETLALAQAAVPGIAPAPIQAVRDVAQGDDDTHRERLNNIALIGGAVLFAFGLLLRLTSAHPFLSLAFFLAAYGLTAAPVLLGTAKSILRLNPFDENFLMSVATIGAFIIGEAPEGVAVMLLYRLGEYLQGRAVRRSRDSIRQMMRLKPDHANLLLGRRAVAVDPAQCRVGDAIEVRPGERVPLDGVVLAGSSSLDVKEMTGESAPRDVAAGDEVISGAVNGSGLLILDVKRPAGDSSVARVLKMVKDSTANKARTERFFTRFARVYTPIVVLAAALLVAIPPLFLGGELREWVYRGLSFLVVSCPCALVLSIPLSYFGGIGAASRRGILVKGGEALEGLARADTAVFDKTGTLTQGVMRVRDVVCAQGQTKETVLTMAAIAESRLDHPIAKAITAAAGPLPERTVEDYENLPGEGIRCRVDGRRVAVGNLRLMAREGLEIQALSGTAAYVAIEGEYAGALLLGDSLRKGVSAALSALKRRGIRRSVMLTGDSQSAAALTAGEAGIDQFHFELLPDQKVLALRSLEGGGNLFIGDGVNDAPVLVAADVGIAMGGVGSDAAIEAADVVLMTDDLGRIGDALDIARATRANVWQNVALALGVKLLVMVLVALGHGKMWMAVLADAGVALLCVLNALRLDLRRTKDAGGLKES